MQISTDDTGNEVWKVVKANNKAWSEKEDITEQMKYVHNDVIFIKLPFIKIFKGKEKYKADYKKWMKHTKVKYYHEMNPLIKVYSNGNFTIVSYNIDMSFTYDDDVVNDWKGFDFMTLVKESGKWLITSDMSARETQ